MKSGRIFPLQIDHIDANIKNNHLSNLRYCTHRQNQNYRFDKEKTSSKYRGVSWHKRTGKWRARITIKNKSYHLGMFDDELLARKAYEAALMSIGEPIT